MGGEGRAEGTAHPSVMDCKRSSSPLGTGCPLPAFLSSLSPLLPPCISVPFPKCLPPEIPQVHCWARTQRDLSESESGCWAGNQGVELLSMFPCHASGRFLIFYFFPCTSLSLLLINLCKVCGKNYRMCVSICVLEQTRAQDGPVFQCWCNE